MTDPSVQPADLSAFLRTRAALLAAWAWLKGKPIATSAGVVAALLLSMFVGLPIEWPFDTTVQPAAVEKSAPVQPQVLTELVDRVYALDARVVDLQGRVAALENSQPPQAVAPRRSAAQRTAPAPSTQPSTAPERRRWGTTDLDREIDAFTQSLDTTTPLEPTK